MEGERFDVWTRSLGDGVSRRRVLAGLGALAVGLLGRGAAGQEVGIATCRERLDNCDRRDQCCEAAEGHRLGCARVSAACAGDYPGERCCGRGAARCADSCACCEGFACIEGHCREVPAGLRGTCRARQNVCGRNGGDEAPCNGDPNCICSRTSAGLVCHDGRCATCLPCEGDGDCRRAGLENARCFRSDQCCGGESSCLTPCGRACGGSGPEVAEVASERAGYGR